MHLRMNPRWLLIAAFLGVLAWAVFGCGEDDPVGPGNGETIKGFIRGQAFLMGDASRTNQIVIQVLAAEDDSQVETTFPNDTGEFITGGLNGGTYHVLASAPIPGYGIARRDNITVIPGQTRDLGIIDIPDTSRVQILDIEPIPFAAVIPRKPEIRGRFLSQGSGIKESTFSLLINNEQHSQDAELVIDDDLMSGTFSYTPILNFAPGVINVSVAIQNRAGNQSRRTWRFNILDGVQRRVPDEYATIQEAYFAANDGDTIMVAPGTHVVDNLFVAKELTFLASAILEEGGTPDMTVLVPNGTRHFRFRDMTSETRLQGFLFKDAFIPGDIEVGGVLWCDSCDITVESCAFENNQVPDGRGGAITMWDGSRMSIIECRFAGNYARRGGAVAAFDNSRPHIEGCLFIDNVALALASEGGLGGAIYMRASQPMVTRCTFYGNRAGVSGAAIMGDGEPVIGQSHIKSEQNLYVANEAVNGTIHLHTGSTFDVKCDGFQSEEQPLSGAAGGYILGENVQLPPDQDAGFCNEAVHDLRLRPDSPFLELPCEPGALPVGCGSRR